MTGLHSKLHPGSDISLTTLLGEAWSSIGGSRLRTFLAMLGIIIGVGSVVLMVAVGEGSRKAVEKAIASLGTDNLIVTPQVQYQQRLHSTSTIIFDSRDAETIASLPTVVAAGASNNMQETNVSLGSITGKSSGLAVTAGFFIAYNWSFSEGETFTSEQIRGNSHVVVIGKSVAAKFFPDETYNHTSIIGRTLDLNGTHFHVVGVLTGKGKDIYGLDQDNFFFVPITTGKNILWKTDDDPAFITRLYVKALPGTLYETITDITALLRKRQKLDEVQNDNFTVSSVASLTRLANETSKALSLLLGAIASISLVVGGIGITNIMLVTVTERTREIGIRKAIGAPSRDILLQFLFEAIIITGMGSFLGLMVGFGGAYFAEQLFSLTVSYNQWPVLVALGMAVIVGVASGLYPAYKASSLQPIEALRDRN